MELGLIVGLFPIIELVSAIVLVYWFYCLVKSNKDIAESQAKIAESLAVISSRLQHEAPVKLNTQD